MLRNLLMFSGVDERCMSFVLKAKGMLFFLKKDGNLTCFHHSLDSHYAEERT